MSPLIQYCTNIIYPLGVIEISAYNDFHQLQNIKNITNL